VQLGCRLAAYRQSVDRTQVTEELNPYEAPRSDTMPIPSSPSRRTVWKLYAYGLTLLQAGGLVVTLPKIRVAEGFDYAVTAVAIIGLFGYVYRRPLWGRRIWMLWSALFPVWDVVMAGWVYPRQNGTGVRPDYFVVLLLALPLYLALIRYAYRSRELWSVPAGQRAG
jgi:hypothetical protein